jgi:O-acetylhomoserine (thiol)-lyase
MQHESPSYRFDTLLIHGNPSHIEAGPTTIPLVHSSAFAYDTAEELEDVFRGRRPGHIYTRIGNPTTEAFERRLAQLEGGVACIATSSGMSAIATTLLNILGTGDEILSSSSLFGGTHSLFTSTLAPLGITTSFVDPTSLQAWEDAITERTRLLFLETIGNPKLDVPDIAAIAAIAHRHRLPLVVDATVSTPYLARVRELGGDIVIHSTSKYINGTANAIGGAIVDCGTFDWGSGRFPHLAPFAERYRQFAFTARLRKQVHRDLGGCPSPTNSFLTAEGMETLALRMERHCDNALRLATFLQGEPSVAWVNYPGLAASASHQVARRQFGNRFGGLVTFGVGSKERAFRCLNGLTLARKLANIGDTKTLVIHPASTICCDTPAAERLQMGVTDDLIRVSVGIEAIDDILQDFSTALMQL